MPTLDYFIQQCWADFQSKKSLGFVVNPTIPILWFGNLDEYEKSALKIVTIGLNPSCMEFCSVKGSKSFDVPLRFPKAASLVNASILSSGEIALYKQAMNKYFINNPYCEWFRYNERILHALDASYRLPDKHRAIHIDIYTPIATSPTWGGLSSNEKAQIVSSNVLSFENWLNCLNPNIIIIAANASIVAKNFKNSQKKACRKENSNAFVPSLNNGYSPYIRGYHITDGRKLIWVKNCNGKPLMDIKNDADVIKYVKNVYVQLSSVCKNQVLSTKTNCH